jgi:hypothetical protein
MAPNLTETDVKVLNIVMIEASANPVSMFEGWINSQRLEELAARQETDPSGLKSSIDHLVHERYIEKAPSKDGSYAVHPTTQAFLFYAHTWYQDDKLSDLYDRVRQEVRRSRHTTLDDVARAMGRERMRWLVEGAILILQDRGVLRCNWQGYTLHVDWTLDT